jgi:hypothetical protein
VIATAPVPTVEADCPAQFTNLGFNGDSFPGGTAPGWTSSVYSGMTMQRWTGSSYEGGVAQGIVARDGWAQIALLYQTGTVCPGSEYEVRVQAGFIPRGSATRWDSSIGVAHGTMNEWEEMEITSNFWEYGNSEITGEGVLRIVATGNTLTVMVRVQIAWADAWVDNITITEVGTVPISPTPTPTISPTPPPTATPTPTIPPDAGPNLLTNGDFEGGFTGGLGIGWTHFERRPGGFVKENAKLGRMGGGIYGFDHGAEDTENIRMSAKVYLVDRSRFDMVTNLRQQLGDEVITVAKIDAHAVIPGDPLGDDPEGMGTWFADWWHNESVQDGHWAHCYYGVNEPEVNTIEGITKTARFELAFTRRCHELGMRTCVINHSFGTPGQLDRMLVPEVVELLSEADYVGYHPYSALPYLMCDPEGFDTVLRYLPIVAMYEERGFRMPPVVYTEGGDHGIDPLGPRTPEIVRDDLVCFEGVMRQYPWTVGLCYFLTAQWPSMQWPDFDLTRFPEIITGIRQANRAHPYDAYEGINAQILGGAREVFDHGIVQQVPTEPGASYIVSGRFAYSFYDGYAGGGHSAFWPSAAEIYVGWDPTGQTANPQSPTIQWTPNLVGRPVAETDRFYRYQRTFTASGSQASVWFRGGQDQAVPSVRIAVDDLWVRRTMTPAAPETPLMRLY